MAGSNWTLHNVFDHPCHRFTPSRPNRHGYVVLYLHGVHLGELHDKPRFIEQFERFGLHVVCPVTNRSWWTDRICMDFDSRISAESHVIDNILPFIEKEIGAKAPKVGLLGTSMGGQGALRIAYKYPDLFPVVAAISPAIDFQHRIADGDEILASMYKDEEAARQDTATLHVHPLNWPRQQFFCCDPTDERWFESADRLRMKLWSLGVPFECDLETVRGGHGFRYYEQMADRAIGFIHEGLEKERLRV